MNSLVCWIASYVINSLWEVCLIGGAGWLVSRWVRRLGPQMEHAVWVSTLMLAVVTPSLPLGRWLSGVFSFLLPTRETSSITFAATESAKTNAKAVTLLSPSIIELVLGLYCMALLYFGVRLVFSMYRTVELRRKATLVSLQPDKDGLWRRCTNVFSVEDARVLSSSQIAGPVTIGLQERALLLPFGFAEECSGDDFLAAVAHECAHMKRRDFQKNLFYETASLVIAFHPVTWMVKSQIAQTREMVCDGVAIERVVDTETYTQSLLRLATMVALSARVSPSHAIGIFDANILEKRVMMMNARRRHFSLFVKYALVASAALLLLSVATGAGAMAVAIAPESSLQASDDANPHGQVYKIGKEVSAPTLVSSVQPEFPKSVRKEKEKFDGSCVIGMVVDSSGVPHEVHIIRSLKPDFDANAIKAVQQYRFSPALRVGEPVAVSVNIEVNFRRF